MPHSWPGWRRSSARAHCAWRRNLSRYARGQPPSPAWPPDGPAARRSCSSPESQLGHRPGRGHRAGDVRPRLRQGPAPVPRSATRSWPTEGRLTLTDGPPHSGPCSARSSTPLWADGGPDPAAGHLLVYYALREARGDLLTVRPDPQLRAIPHVTRDDGDRRSRPGRPWHGIAVRPLSCRAAGHPTLGVTVAGPPLRGVGRGARAGRQAPAGAAAGPARDYRRSGAVVASCHRARSSLAVLTFLATITATPRMGPSRTPSPTAHRRVTFAPRVP